MNDPLRKQTVEDWANDALKMIAEQNLQPYPDVYSIFFEYARRANKKLVADLQNLITRKTPLTEKLITELHSRHVTNDFDKKILEESGQKVQQIMGEVMRAIDTSSKESKTFSSNMDSLSKDLEGVTEQENLQSVVKHLMEKTREFKAQGELLQQKLEQSRAEVDTLKTNLEQASTAAMIDALTGVANRKAFDENITQLTATCKAEGRQLCLLMVDIDHFKKFNDTFGHLIGDQVIKIVASALKDLVKGKDFVARYGGEEFAVLLPDTPLKGGQIVADSIRSNIAGRELKRKDTGESYGQITVSIGVTMYNPVRDKIDDFIARADKALYISKRNGRNRVSTEE